MNIFNYSNKQVRGFTLIELLVVIAIIGLLSTVIAQPVTQAFKKARDGKKISDIHAIEAALQSYATANGGYYPNTLADLVTSKDLPKLPTNADGATVLRDKYMYVVYQNSDVPPKNMGYHLGVKLEVNGPALDDDKDCTGLSGTTPCLVYSGTAVATNVGSTGFSTGANVAYSGSADFDGADLGSKENCSSTVFFGTGACIYDLTQ